jgi:hypothetical protein
MDNFSRDDNNPMDEWFSGLPAEVTRLYVWLEENTKRFETFDLLANVCFYNHLHNPEEYTDYRGDRHFFVPEILALLCLKGDYIEESTINDEDFFSTIKDIQGNILKYSGMKDAIGLDGMPTAKDAISDIARILEREAKVIRNPGLPDHHLDFASKLFEPIKETIKATYGFSISDSLVIRNKISRFLNEKVISAKNSIFDDVKACMNEIVRFRKTKLYPVNSKFSKDDLEELSAMNYKDARKFIKDYFSIQIHLKFGAIYSFTAEELSKFTEIDLVSVKSYLSLFSCEFPSLKNADEIHETNSILKQIPIVHYKGRYLLVSIPLMFWAPEIVFEEGIKQNAKLSGRYSKIKHDFVLEESLLYFKDLMPTAKILPSNLYYTIGENRFETDAIIMYDTVLFIIEAKGHRISVKAKSGNMQRTENHLKEIVKESYQQGIRTLKYIEENDEVEFNTDHSGKFKIRKSDFDEIVIVTLTLEPVGNLAMSIKATDSLGYFKEGYFPWIISIYDLIVLRDMIENPFMFIHYIRKRKEFLSHNHVSTYEETDLLGYFLFNGLNINNVLKDSEGNAYSHILLEPNTDAINDYYLYKFGKKEKFTKKPSCYLPVAMNDFLLQFDQSRLEHRIKVALIMLQFDNGSIKSFIDRVKITKKDFSKDRQLHDGSLFNDQLNFGMTHMTCANKNELDLKLYQYCHYKFNQLNANVWVGIADMGTDQNKFDFTGMFFMSKEEPQLL